MAVDHQIPKSTMSETILWVEERLIETEEFKIKELRERFKPEEKSVISVIVVDVEEQPIERPNV